MPNITRIDVGSIQWSLDRSFIRSPERVQREKHSQLVDIIPFGYDFASRKQSSGTILPLDNAHPLVDRRRVL